MADDIKTAEEKTIEVQSQEAAEAQKLFEVGEPIELDVTIIGVTKAFNVKTGEQTDVLEFETTETFPNINIETGKHQMTSKFTKHPFALSEELTPICSEIRSIKTLTLSKNVDPVILGLLTIDSTMKIRRRPVRQGEKRKSTNDRYTSDSWTTDIISIKTNISSYNAAQIQTIIKEERERKNKKTAPNPFDIFN